MFLRAISIPAWDFEAFASSNRNKPDNFSEPQNDGIEMQTLCSFPSRGAALV
jgi:hypothetical protein